MKMLLASLLLAAGTGEALAWGATGHHMITELAMQRLPDELPAFLRTVGVPFRAGEIAREPDRSKDAGASHDADRNPGHYIAVDDAGRVLGGPALADLPPTREKFDTALREVGATQYRSGFLAYQIVDGWQQLAKDFAYWRVLVAAEQRATDPGAAARFARDREIREMLILRDLAVWSHFVGDGSQPLHVSVHHYGWGDYPNPEAFPTENLDGLFQGTFVRANISAAEVAAVVPAPAALDGDIWAETKTYLAATHAEVLPLYRLAKAHGFATPVPETKTFAAARLAAGVAEVRDLVVAAWHASETMPVGWPEITLQQVEAGADPTGPLFGLD